MVDHVGGKDVQRAAAAVVQRRPAPGGAVRPVDCPEGRRVGPGQRQLRAVGAGKGPLAHAAPAAALARQPAVCPRGAARERRRRQERQEEEEEKTHGSEKERGKKGNCSLVDCFYDVLQRCEVNVCIKIEVFPVVALKETYKMLS